MNRNYRVIGHRSEYESNDLAIREFLLPEGPSCLVGGHPHHPSHGVKFLRDMNTLHPHRFSAVRENQSQIPRHQGLLATYMPRAIPGFTPLYTTYHRASGSMLPLSTCRGDSDRIRITSVCACDVEGSPGDGITCAVALRGVFWCVVS